MGSAWPAFHSSFDTLVVYYTISEYSNIVTNRRVATMNNEAKAILSIFTLSTLLLSSSATVVATAGGPTVCDGILPPGTYHSIVVPAGQTCVLGLISLSPLQIGPVTVNGGILIETGATFYLGYEGGPPSGTINGGITADNAGRVFVHNAQINGGINVQGGVGPFSPSCNTLNPTFHTCSDDFEDSTIHGAVTINGFNGFYLGFIRNHDSGSVTVSGNTVVDEIDIGTLVVNGNLMCSGNTPLENTGVSPGAPPSIVTGQDTCSGT